MSLSRALSTLFLPWLPGGGQVWSARTGSDRARVAPLLRLQVPRLRAGLSQTGYDQTGHMQQCPPRGEGCVRGCAVAGVRVVLHWRQRRGARSSSLSPCCCRCGLGVSTPWLRPGRPHEPPAVRCSDCCRPVCHMNLEGRPLVPLSQEGRGVCWGRSHFHKCNCLRSTFIFPGIKNKHPHRSGSLICVVSAPRRVCAFPQWDRWGSFHKCDSC